MKHRLVILFSILLSAIGHAEVKSFVDRTEIHTDETFYLTIELDDFTNEEPDLSIIPADIQVLGSSQYHRSSSINGVTNTQLGWKVQLLIKKEGIYTIPGFSIAGESSQPIQVKVKPSTEKFSTDEEDQAIFIKSELNKESVYVQEQLLYTIKLYRSLQTQYASLTEPVIAGVLIEKVGDDVQYDAIIEGKRYWILERKYVIFPQKSGLLSIPKIVFSADVVMRDNSSYGGRILGRTKPITISTQEKNVNVKPFPLNHQGPWLPTSSLTLQGQLSESQQKTVGEPTTWTITMQGIGLHENQLPDLTLPQTDGLKWYPDAPQKSRKYTSSGIESQRIDRIAMVPTQQGKIQTPPLRIRWFNTTTEKYEYAELPPQILEVRANPESTINQPFDNSNSRTIETTSDNTAPNSHPAPNPIWIWSTIVFALLWLLTMILWFTRSKSPIVEHTVYTQPTQNSSTRQEVLKACRTGNNRHIYNTLINWIENTAQVRSLQPVLQKMSDPVIKQSLLQLEISLFSSGDQPSWQDRDKLMGWLSTIEATLKPKATQTSPKLPSLYPE